MAKAKHTPEATETDTTEAPVESSRTGRWFAGLFILLVIAGAIAAAYFYVWPSFQKLLQDEPTAAATETPVTAKLEQLDQRVNGLQQQLSQLNADQARYATVDAMQQSQAQLYQELRATQQALAALQTEIGLLDLSAQANWRIIEAHQFTQRATVKLWVEGEPEAAQQLLQLAHDQLAQLNNPAHLTARQALQNDIQTLRALPAAQHLDAALSLASLRSLVSEIDWTQTPQSSFAKPVERDLGDDWLSNLKRSALALSDQFIRIQTHEQPVEPLLSHSFTLLAEQRLLLQLQLAQQAALSGDQTLYVLSLNEATELVAQLDGIDDTRVTTLASQLNALTDLTLQASYPDSLQSPALVARLAEKLLNDAAGETP
ncbi:uroporphyrinogen-III C-methyltransferase [Pseudidiomarina taiwanensis]|uniref:Heme biosynthesis operon protein HemX n=1 Tax=Pseudidiomarina taiwanensis TaxID=337250 RepID=A0A432ZF82_9GAMM|nr:uroporphyrinogen-III C-methyltransferase [Pseudidiomarina taiwanensis]RUO76626.1 hypothetical protein CWI83_06755 [Pseudidiomarina taiwanensis]